MYDVKLCRMLRYLYVQSLPQTMYMHINRYHLLKCIHLLAYPLYMKLHIQRVFFGNEFIYDETGLFTIICVYETAGLFGYVINL
jgi:hypothetical protein